MKEKQTEELLTPKEKELEQEVQVQIADKDVTKNKSKLKGYKGLKKLIPYYTKYKKLAILLSVSLIITTVLNFFIPIYDAKALASITSGDFKFAIIF